MKYFSPKKTYLLFLLLVLVIIIISNKTKSINFDKFAEDFFISYLKVKLFLPEMVKNKRLLNDFEKTTLLRKWLYQNTVYANDNLSWEAQETYNFNSTLNLYLYYKQLKGGAKCNNIAYFFNKLLGKFGFISYSYHYGDLNAFNHVINLVEINYNNKKILILQDSTYNLTFLDKKNNPLDFFSLLKFIKNNELNEIKPSIINYQKRPILYNATTIYLETKPNSSDVIGNLHSLLKARLIENDKNNMLFKKIKKFTLNN